MVTAEEKYSYQKNLKKRGWQGDTKCSFCGREEDVEHLFIHCSVAKMLWMVMKCSFNIHDVPERINDIFGRWLTKF